METDVTTEVVVVATVLVVFICVVLFGTGVTAEVVVVTQQLFLLRWQLNFIFAFKIIKEIKFKKTKYHLI